MSNSLSPFQLARIKLTGWYMLMFIGLIGVFTYLTLDAKKSTYVRVYQVIQTGQPSDSPQLVEFKDKYAEFNRRFKERLIIFDCLLIGASGYLSYFLSGKTLKPIKEMLSEQQAFASDVSHSLRTPLTTIGLELEAYSRSHTNINQEMRSLLNSIQEEVFSMNQLVSGMLALVRSGTDSFKTKFAPLKIDDLLSSMSLKMKPLAKAKDQEIKLTSLKPLSILGNSDSLRQVLYILLDNAIKYSGSGSLIRIGMDKKIKSVNLWISDNGKGIPTRDLPHIFNRYYRADQKTKGTGLGLAIAQKLITHHGGTIKVKSKIGVGTTFTIILPIGS
jgi:two-component system, OmpR family, sensor histidine kinase CiaH